MRRNQPKYQHIYDQLKQRLDDGWWPVGHQLPSELSLAKEFQASYMTVRQAVRLLVDEGRVLRVQGRGTFVSEPSRLAKSATIGLMLPEKWVDADPYNLPALTSGYIEEASRRGLHVDVSVRTDAASDAARLHNLGIKAVTTVLSGTGDLDELHALLDRELAVVSVNYSGRRRVPTVTADNFGGSWAAACHLIAAGHREIAFLTPADKDFDTTQRLSGIEQAMKGSSHNVQVHTARGKHLEETGYELGQRLLKAHRLPTAVMAACDLVALGALRAFTEAGLRIPHDISIVGFGDIGPSAFLTPSLTTVSVPMEEIGRQAAKALINRMNGVPQADVTVPCNLVIRESSGPPPQARQLKAAR